MIYFFRSRSILPDLFTNSAAPSDTHRHSHNLGSADVLPAKQNSGAKSISYSLLVNSVEPQNLDQAPREDDKDSEGHVQTEAHVPNWVVGLGCLLQETSVYCRLFHPMSRPL